MGNEFSTRWNGVQTRRETGGLPFLDTAHLRRIGALNAGAVMDLAWTNPRGDLIATIRTEMHPSGDALTITGPRGTEPVPVDWMPCTAGGYQGFLLCPGCGKRRRVLYGAGMVFRCRRCHDLAYSVTRERDTDRARRRLAKLYDRLGAVPDTPGGIPPQPSHMYRKTYDRIVRQLKREYAAQAAMLAALDRPG